MIAPVKEERIRTVFDALADPNRFRIFKILLRKKDICVSEIAEELNISIPAASQHLRILELSGLLEPERHGQKICYRIRANDSFILSIIKILKA